MTRLVQITRLSGTLAVSLPPIAANLLAYYCVNNKQYQLSGTGDGELLWYQHSTDTIPFAYGPSVPVSQAPVNNIWYAGLNDFKGSVGPATKYVFSGGGYNQFTPYVSVSTQIPVIIETRAFVYWKFGQNNF